MLEFKELKALGQVAGHKIHKWRATALTHAKSQLKDTVVKKPSPTIQTKKIMHLRVNLHKMGNISKRKHSRKAERWK